MDEETARKYNAELIDYQMTSLNKSVGELAQKVDSLTAAVLTMPDKLSERMDSKIHTHKNECDKGKNSSGNTGKRNSLSAKLSTSYLLACILTRMPNRFWIIIAVFAISIIILSTNVLTVNDLIKFYTASK